jgi:hypothetical protein
MTAAMKIPAVMGAGGGLRDESTLMVYLEA